MNSVDINMYTTNAEVLSEAQLTEILSSLRNSDSVDATLDRMMEAYDSTPVTSEESEPQESIVAETQPEPIEEKRPKLEPILPENSKTILINEYTSRFTDAIWYNTIRNLRVVLAGLGGIGSYIGFLLSRLQVGNLRLYDPDTVESVNISGQMYPTASIGETKVSALVNLIRDFSDFYSYRSIPQRYTEDSPAGPIMICGFDNMEARKVFFCNWLRHVKSSESPEKCLFIDGRIKC